MPIRKPWSKDDNDVKTTFFKIRFNPATLLVDTGDFTYTKSKGFCSHHKETNPDKVPFGSAFGCEKPEFADSMAKIDLRGTPYAVDDSFDFGGYCATGNVVFSGDNQVVDIKGGGYCGWMVPTKANNAGEVAAHLGGWFLKLKLLN